MMRGQQAWGICHEVALTPHASLPRLQRCREAQTQQEESRRARQAGGQRYLGQKEG